MDIFQVHKKTIRLCLHEIEQLGTVKTLIRAAALKVFSHNFGYNLLNRNYRVQAKSFDIGDWTFVLEFKSRRRPKTPRSDVEKKIESNFYKQLICDANI